MTVTLNKRCEELVRQRLVAGQCASPDEAANQIIEEQFNGLFEDEELAASLIASLDSPRHIYRKGAFGEMMRGWSAERNGE